MRCALSRAWHVGPQRGKELIQAAFGDIVTSLEAPLDEALAAARTSPAVRMVFIGAMSRMQTPSWPRL
jgi:hypothetical protein